MESSQSKTNPALPSLSLLKEQAEWLNPARSRLLRRISIARRKSILDLGAAYGVVTDELVRRAGGLVVGFDNKYHTLREIHNSNSTGAVAGDAHLLPFAAGAFDLIFCQYALMWMDPLELVLDETKRVIQADGLLVALEPDYFSMIEYPPEIATSSIWIAALERSGARPQVGRELPSLLANRGFEVRVDLLERLYPPSPARFQLLRELSLTGFEHTTLAKIEEHSAELGEWEQIVHLPIFLITAKHPG